MPRPVWVNLISQKEVFKQLTVFHTCRLKHNYIALGIIFKNILHTHTRTHTYTHTHTHTH